MMSPRESWLVTGAAGRLGHELCRHLMASGRRVVAFSHERPIDIVGLSSQTVDLLDRASVERAITEADCRYVVHTAGLTDVDGCESQPAKARQIHVDATRFVATVARSCGAAFVQISTDHLWNGLRQFVDEEAPPQPMNVYAHTKFEGELAALAAHDGALIIRTNFFGRGRPWRPSFSDWIESSLRQGRRLTMFRDVFFTPIAMRLLCPAIVEMAARGATGVFHVAGRERLSKYEFAVRFTERFGFDRGRIEPVSIVDFGLKAPRPKDMSLATDKAARFIGRAMPDCGESLDALCNEMGESYAVSR